MWAYSKGDKQVSETLVAPVREFVEANRAETVAVVPTAAEVPQISTETSRTEANIEAAEVVVVATITDWTKCSKVTA